VEAGARVFLKKGAGSCKLLGSFLFCGAFPRFELPNEKWFRRLPGMIVCGEDVKFRQGKNCLIPDVCSRTSDL